MYVTLGPMFNDVDMSRQIAEGEKLGSPQIPRVGELAKIKDINCESNRFVKGAWLLIMSECHLKNENCGGRCTGYDGSKIWG